MKHGTRVFIRHLPLGASQWVWEQTGIIRKPLPVNLPMPSPDWRIVEFDSGGKMCIHHESLRAV